MGQAAPRGIGSGRSGDWREDPLQFLVAPVARAEFFDRFYEREPLVAARGEPERHAGLLTLADVDRFIAGADLREGMVDLTSRGNRRLSRDDYVDRQGRVLRNAVVEHYLNGATVILPHLHDSLPPLGEFCRSLEEVFTCHVQTNVYLTPSGNQGFPIHYDNHDVFVMQISGAKAWRLYGTPVAIPYRGEGFEADRYEPGGISREFTLRPGDCLYLPRGVMHDAENAGEDPSLHITVGLITKTWADLMLEAVSELALEEPGFRRSLPPGYATRDFDRAEARRHFDALTRAIAGKAGMDSAFDLLADEFLRSRSPDVAGVIAGRSPVPAPDDRFRRRRFAPWSLAEDADRLVLVGPGGDLEFAGADGDALEIALSGAPFGVADLPCEDAPALVRRLWANGYLERLSG